MACRRLAGVVPRLLPAVVCCPSPRCRASPAVTCGVANYARLHLFAGRDPGRRATSAMTGPAAEQGGLFRSTSQVKKSVGSYPRVRVEGGGRSVVSQAGAALLVERLRKSGLDQAISGAPAAAQAGHHRPPPHPPPRRALALGACDQQRARPARCPAEPWLTSSVPSLRNRRRRAGSLWGRDHSRRAAPAQSRSTDLPLSRLGKWVARTVRRRPNIRQIVRHIGEEWGVAVRVLAHQRRPVAAVKGIVAEPRRQFPGGRE